MVHGEALPEAELHERKGEIDSLCYPVRLAHGYWRATGDASVFDAEWRAAAAATLRTRERSRGPFVPAGARGDPRGHRFMHEAFDQDDPRRFTREWFAWANTLSGELVLKVRAERPHLLKERL